jgi:cobalamin-dependent methionine synthase I
MPRVISSPEQFTIIGENIHATRVVLRNGRRAVTQDDGTEAVPFKGESGEQRYLTVPEWFKKTQPYEQGQIKHFMIAMKKGISDDPEEREQGAAYIQYEVRRQVRSGASYLDINVDEVDYDVDVQKRCMRWTVETAQEVSSVPPCVDSSLSEIIAEGLAAYDGRAGRPLVNSVAFERLDVLDMALEHNARIKVMATSATGMPQDADERVANINAIMEPVRAKGVLLTDVFIDGIVFLISVDSQNCNHYMNAVRSLRETYGNEVHIGGGLSNVSFGLPKRKLINDAFIYLALDAGIDSGIIDPIQTKLGSVFDLDTESEPVKLAMNMLLGRDDFCTDFIMAFREGRLG